MNFRATIRYRTKGGRNLTVGVSLTDTQRYIQVKYARVVVDRMKHTDIQGDGTKRTRTVQEGGYKANQYQIRKCSIYQTVLTRR